VKKVGEHYTSQACPFCGNRKKPSGRSYRCGCGFEGHRDMVGAENIRRKYVGASRSRLPGVMASPSGVRFHSHLQCSSPVAARKTPAKGQPV
jgi:putative transposase